MVIAPGSGQRRRKPRSRRSLALRGRLARLCAGWLLPSVPTTNRQTDSECAEASCAPRPSLRLHLLLSRHRLPLLLMATRMQDIALAAGPLLARAAATWQTHGSDHAGSLTRPTTCLAHRRVSILAFPLAPLLKTTPWQPGGETRDIRSMSAAFVQTGRRLQVAGCKHA